MLKHIIYRIVGWIKKRTEQAGPEFAMGWKARRRMCHFDLTKIFKNDPKLHVLVWNRFDEDINKSAMLLVRDFLEDKELGDYVLPMLYPLGRYDSDFERMSNESDETYPQDEYCFDHYGELNNNGEQRTDRAELCLQVAGRYEEKAWNEIVEWIDNNEDCFAWRSRSNPVWEPLGSSFQECQYKHVTNDIATKFLCDLKEQVPWFLKLIRYRATKEQVPWFLKLIWYRATEVICDNLVEQSDVRLINPRDAQDRDLLCHMLNQTFHEIEVNKLGLALGSTSVSTVEPDRFGAAHLAASAFSAVTVVQQQHYYQLEYYANGDRNATHPYVFRNLEEYIKRWCPNWTS